MQLRRHLRFAFRLAMSIGWAVLFFWLLKVSGAATSPIAVIIGAVTLALGFALQTVLTNFLEGRWIQIEHDFDDDDWIQVEGTTIVGRVLRQRVRTVHLEKVDGGVTFVPYSQLFTASVTRLSPESVEKIKNPPPPAAA